MKYFEFSYLYIVVVLLGCLPGTPLKAQSLDPDYYSSFQRNQLRIQKGTKLGRALEVIGQRFDVVFLYRTDVIKNKKVVSTITLPDNVKKALQELLEGQKLMFRHTNIKTYGIYPDDPIKPKRKTISVEQISGKVTDNSTDEALPSVNIKVKGTTTGTFTDDEGHYELGVASLQDTLVFSFVGYQQEEVPIDGRTTVDVALKGQALTGEELVVVGYGKEQKSNVISSISTVSGEDLANRNTTTVSNALQGAVSGVMVRRNSGDPGSGASIRIRGITSIGNSNPLIIVDGVPRDNIDDLNPDNIKSVSVLKDAASASIYGARAASGVVLITTKRANSNELNVGYNVEYDIEKPTESPGYTGPIRYMKMANESRWNEQGNPSEGEYPIYAKNVIDNYYELNSSDPNKYPIENFQELMLKDYAPGQRHHLNIAGGSEDVKVRGSLSYEKMDGLYYHRNYQKMNARLNSDVTIKENLLNAKMDIFFNRNIQKRPNLGNPIYWARQQAPIYAARWEDGRIASGKTGDNYYGKLREGGWRHNWGNIFGGKVELNYQPLAGLELTGRIAPELNFDKGKNFQKQIPYYAADDPTEFIGYLTGYDQTNLYESRNENYKYTIQFLGNYQKEFGAHSLKAMAGYEENKSSTENLGASREDFGLKSYPYLSMGPLEYRDNSGGAYENAYRSVFGRISYDFKDKYLLQGSIRYDGSSRFAPDYRWGTFPSISAGWVLSEESFLEKSAPLSYLKLRASYGTLGNERIGNYPYQSTLGFNDALFYQGSNIVSSTTAAQIAWNIPDITWEETSTYNIGIDVNFFDDKLQFTGDYYRKYTKDMLLALEIPDYLGYNNPQQNAGKMNTKGWGLDLTWNDNFGELTYSISANLSDSKTKMGYLGGTEFKGNQISANGTQYNEWYGYKSDGLFQTQEEIENSAVTNDAVRPGDVKYIDISGPGGKPDGKISPEYDRVPLGGSLPRYLFGANLRMGYKNFDFSLQIQGVGKQNARLSDIMIQPLGTYWHNIPKLIVGNYWSQYNSKEENRNAKYPRLSEIGKSNNYAMSDYWLFDGSYLRIKNIGIGYVLPQNLTDQISIQQIKLYVNVSDAYSFDNYPKGWDPEVAASGYPITTSFTFGANIKF